MRVAESEEGLKKGNSKAQQGAETAFGNVGVYLEKYIQEPRHIEIQIIGDLINYFVGKNEYPEFGLEAEVYHHTEVIYQLIQEGRIKPTKEVKEEIAYHDSCYLGRYNGVFDIPRQILKAIPGVRVHEMERNREDAMCCGAGGGRMWMEETQGKRINVERTEQALQLNPTMIGSNSPYCLTMLSDGTKAKEVEEQVKTMDIVEIVERSLAG
jgi:Fe-S oxidoreductase